MNTIYKHFSLILEEYIKQGIVEDESDFDTIFYDQVMPESIDIEDFDEKLELLILNELKLATSYLTIDYDRNISIQNKYLKQIFLRNIRENNITYAIYAMALKINEIHKYNALYKFNAKEFSVLSNKFNNKPLEDVFLEDIEKCTISKFMSNSNKKALTKYLSAEIRLRLNNINCSNDIKISINENEAMKAEFDSMFLMLNRTIKERKCLEEFWEEL